MHTPNMLAFIQRLNLRNSTTSQVIVRIWHKARPRKVGTLIWLTFNQGLPVGTWLQLMGIPPPLQSLRLKNRGIAIALLARMPHGTTRLGSLQKNMGRMECA